ncbi:TonB family protein [Kangiella sp. HD9-110m-PIT-SAG07]|nr:TonB family protein [Kangiella sp. HD9-110m-PIT-SAG07]
MTHIKAVLLLITLFVTGNAQATFTKATEYYDKKQYEKAFSEFEKLAKIGHKSSQFNLGVLYLEGIGTEQDLVKAYAWVKLSDENNNKEKDFLTEIEDYINSEQGIIQAEANYQSLKLKYGTKAIVEKYKPELTDIKVEKNRPKPVKYSPASYPDRAQLSGIEGLVTVALHVSPSGFPTDMRVIEEYPVRYFRRNTLKALSSWSFEANEQGLNELYYYRMDYQLGDSEVERLGELKQKALDGDPTSQYLYGKYGEFDGMSHAKKGINFNQNQWYFEAARNGVVNAQHKVADNLLEGKGCTADPEKAIAWLTIAASAGYKPSKFFLAKLSYDNGNNEQGLDWLIQSFATEDTNLSYKLIQYVVDNDIQGVPPRVLKLHLDRVLDKGVTNPVQVYYFYAKYYERSGDIAEAVDYQTNAINELKDLGEKNIPKQMDDYLAHLNSKPT